MKQAFGKFTILFLAVLLALGIMGEGLTAFAKTTKQVIITTNTDDNPFIRIFLNNVMFKSGGPFTIKCEIKIENFKKRKPSGVIFVDIYDGRKKGVPVVVLNSWAKNMDWFELKDIYGNDITFENVNKVLIDSTFQPYALFNMGAIYCNATVYYRNFRIYNAANELIYSWDTDKDFEGINNIKNIKSPEPLIMGLSFCDGSGTFMVSDVELPDKDSSAVSKPDSSSSKSSHSSAAATKSSKTSLDSSSESASDTDSDISEAMTESKDVSSGYKQTEIEKTPFNIWIPVGIVGGVLVVGILALLILLKMKKLRG